MQQDDADCRADRPQPETSEAATRARQPAAPAEDEKVKPQHLSQTQRYAIGVAIFLFALGAWSYKKHGPGIYPPSLQPKGLQVPEVFGQTAGLVEPGLGDVDLEGGPENLEDALSTLEASGSWASQGSQLPERTIELPAAAKRQKKAAKAKPVAKEPEELPEEPKAKAKKQPKQKASKVSSEAEAALDKLEAGPAGRKSKRSKPSESEQEKAQAIIRDYLEKMQSKAEQPADEDAGLSDKNLKERLQAMVQDEEERDRDPDIRKAKGIIKDLLTKMDAPKSGKDKASSEGEAEEEEGPAGDPSHLEFAERLKEEAAVKGDHDMASVREEFKREFGGDARRMLCSGCKLVAGRLDSELSAHDVHDAESPAHMLASKRKAIDATCRSFRHLHVANDDGGPRFVAGEASEDEESALRLGQKLCTAVLEDSKFEVLSRLIRRKVPQASLFHGAESVSNNWERLLCAQRARVCKRNEVKEEEDDEEL